MPSNLFAHPYVLFTGALTGIALGFLLQKGRVSQFNVIVGQFLFKEFALLKIMLTAIIVGSLGMHLMIAIDLPVDMHIKSSFLLAVALGSALFGIGMVVLGYCPGTCVVAAGQGSRDAWWGILGMIFGAGSYAVVYPWLKETVLTIMPITKTTLPELFAISPWIILAGLAAVSLVLFWLLSKR